jgi:hypothetical protein
VAGVTNHGGKEGTEFPDLRISVPPCLRGS